MVGWAELGWAISNTGNVDIYLPISSHVRFIGENRWKNCNKVIR